MDKVFKGGLCVRMEINLGFIGAGNMGTALAKGIIKSKLLSPENVFVFDIYEEKAQKIKEETGVKTADKIEDLVLRCDIVILAVKPNVVKQALEPCKDLFDGNKLLISIAAGVPTWVYKDILGKNSKIIRTMPNTPALVGEGMTLIAFDENTRKEDIEKAKMLFECVGKVELLDEKLMNEVVALTSSSPAYVFMFIEAMADAAVLSGIARDVAYKLAAQAVLGSARMVLETGKHPGVLKDQVCSPGGTTIEAVGSLEKNGFRYAVIDAMNKCTRKAKEISGLMGDRI